MPRRILFKGFFYKTFGGGDNFGGCYFVLWAIFKGNVVLIHIYTYMHTYTYKYSNTQSHLWWWRRTWPSSWWARCPCSARRSREGCGSSGGDHGDNNENHGGHKSWGETPRKKLFKAQNVNSQRRGNRRFQKVLAWNEMESCRQNVILNSFHFSLNKIQLLGGKSMWWR